MRDNEQSGVMQRLEALEKAAGIITGIANVKESSHDAEKTVPSIGEMLAWFQMVSNNAPAMIAILQQLMVLLPPQTISSKGKETWTQETN